MGSGDPPDLRQGIASVEEDVFGQVGPNVENELLFPIRIGTWEPVVFLHDVTEAPQRTQPRL